MLQHDQPVAVHALVGKAVAGRPRLLLAVGLLAKMKGLRGTAFDIFGHTEERKMERRWIADYRAGVDKALAGLSAESLATAVELARVPEDIRGYGHVKARHEHAAKAKWDVLIAKV